MKNTRPLNEQQLREDWLKKATALVNPVLHKTMTEVSENHHSRSSEKGHEYKKFEKYKVGTDRIKVSCGFPYGRKSAIGQCWQESASEGKFFEIFVSPTQAKARDVLAVLIHELVHANLPPKEGHGHKFKSVVYAMGLAGKATATVPGEDFDIRYENILAKLGEYPHAKLNTSKVVIGAPKKEGTRMLKAICNDCGYTIRLAKSWAEQGLPTCVCSGEFSLEEK